MAASTTWRREFRSMPVGALGIAARHGLEISFISSWVNWRVRWLTWSRMRLGLGQIVEESGLLGL